MINPLSGVRVRFAPSPTGFLHLGGLRTALYNFLFARAHKGKFILRIEDTDQTRLVQGATEQLNKDLVWAGIKIDEGPQHGGPFGPYIQSHRIDIYKDHVKTLLDKGWAYRCFCTDRRLELLKREAVRTRQVPKYDNRCRGLSPEDVQKKIEKGETSCIRFKLSPGLETFNDLIYGEIAYDVTANEGDPVIIKSDGFPTYHFANVVDDHTMQISHVLRGVEWQISTTKHLLLYRAFGWNPPLYAHLPLLVNPDGTKLSKRQGDIKISHYRDTGIFPLALVNFITSSGGGFEKDIERHLKPQCYTFDELTEQFDVSRINSHPGKVKMERLEEFNRLELKRLLRTPGEEQRLIGEVKRMVEENLGLSGGSLQTNPEHIRHILLWSTDRISKLTDLISNQFKFIWICPKDYNISPESLSQLELFVARFRLLNASDRDGFNKFFKQFCGETGLKFSDFMKTLRSILSGLKEGPSVAEMVEILGKNATVDRLERCINNNVLR